LGNGRLYFITTVLIPLILKVEDIIFFSRAKHIMGHCFRYAQHNLGVIKVSAPSKNPKKCPIICFAPDKKIISRTFKIRGALVFLCPKEGEERREKKGERREKRDKRRETRDERREKRDERRETRDERREKREERRETRDER
jgi:hypothetical protein